MATFSTEEEACVPGWNDGLVVSMAVWHDLNEKYKELLYKFHGEWMSAENCQERKIVLIGSNESDCILMGMKAGGLWFTADGNREPITYVTHYMELPDPPNGD